MRLREAKRDLVFPGMKNAGMLSKLALLLLAVWLGAVEVLLQMMFPLMLLGSPAPNPPPSEPRSDPSCMSCLISPNPSFESDVSSSISRDCSPSGD